MRSINVAIVGGGTVGLSVATKLIESIEPLDVNVTITIIAEHFYQDTTSFGSGGLWEPYQIAGTPDEKINYWGKESFEHFRDIFYSDDAGIAGVQLITTYNLLQPGQRLEIPSWKDIVPNFQVLGKADLAKLGLSAKFTSGFTFGTFVVEQKYYMKYLSDRLASKGVLFIQERVESVERLARTGRFDCVVNCTGLGAMEAAADPSMYPIRGQVLRVSAPWIKDVWFFGTSYVIPNVDSVVLGGTAERGCFDTTVRAVDSEKILDDICELLPSIRSAPVLKEWVGLRPGRAPLRLDSEHIEHGEERRLLVHCYGHGGSGITLAMGCAGQVCREHLLPFLAARQQQADFPPRVVVKRPRHKSRL